MPLLSDTGGPGDGGPDDGLGEERRRRRRTVTDHEGGGDDAHGKMKVRTLVMAFSCTIKNWYFFVIGEGGNLRKSTSEEMDKKILL